MNKYTKYLILPFCFAFVLITVIWAADTNKITRFTRGFIVQGGTSSTTGNSVVEADAVTNCFRMVIVTATVTGVQTASTNTFTTAFVATPTVFKGEISGANASAITNANLAGVTVTTTGVIVTGLSTNGLSGANNLPLLIYGYPRTGVLQ